MATSRFPRRDEPVLTRAMGKVSLEVVPRIDMVLSRRVMMEGRSRGWIYFLVVMRGFQSTLC